MLLSLGKKESYTFDEEKVSSVSSCVPLLKMAEIRGESQNAVWWKLVEANFTGGGGRRLPIQINEN